MIVPERGDTFLIIIVLAVLFLFFAFVSEWMNTRARRQQLIAHSGTAVLLKGLLRLSIMVLIIWPSGALMRRWRLRKDRPLLPLDGGRR